MIQYLMNMSFQLKFSYGDVFLFFNENLSVKEATEKMNERNFERPIYMYIQDQRKRRAHTVWTILCTLSLTKQIIARPAGRFDRSISLKGRLFQAFIHPICCI